MLLDRARKFARRKRWLDEEHVPSEFELAFPQPTREEQLKSEKIPGKLKVEEMARTYTKSTASRRIPLEALEAARGNRRGEVLAVEEWETEEKDGKLIHKANSQASLDLLSGNRRIDSPN